MEVLTTFISKALITELSKKLMNSLELGSKAREIIAKFKVEGVAASYAEKTIGRVIKFKTLTSKGAVCYLDEVYYPLKLSNINSSQHGQFFSDGFVIKDGSRLVENSCIIISGKAGQGKTTIMRKLFVEELKHGERFPFFITLRDQGYDKGSTAIDLLREHLHEHGIECSLLGVEALIRSKKIVIFFDGFDEIKKSDRKQAIKIINSLNVTYGCPSIITTRPDTELEDYIQAIHFYVKNLNENDFYGIINKLIHNEETKKPIISILKKNNSLRETICTPILVSIFIITYPSLQSEPQSIADFYDTLFHALIYQHDASKSFIREKKSGLDNKKLEECFSYFSLSTYMRAVSTFNYRALIDDFHETCENLNIENKYEGVMDDVVNGTNLITLDGHDRYVYIHRSIQEYFSAKCIQGFDEESKELAYKELYSPGDFFTKGQYILRMLSLIDSLYLSKFYIIPNLEIMKFNVATFEPIPKEKFIDELKKIEISYTPSGGEKTEYRINHFSNGSYSSKLGNQKDIIDVTSDIVGVISPFDIYSCSTKSFLYEKLHNRSEEILDYLSRKYPDLESLNIYIKKIDYRKDMTNKSRYMPSKFISSKYWFECFDSNDVDEIYKVYLTEVETLRNYVTYNFYNKKSSSSSMLDLLKSKKNKRT
ncbi:NACHT domain-containing protein [Pectobacterium brasiliense]|uniref:NACHT domain-containing protein n=1 Tax=Pectobacterium brasiliense TaxID=180957 RepID=UPI0039862317